MCGISGIYEYASGQPVSPEVLGGMLQAIYHRGPDDDGSHLDRNLAIGMRRLSIIDLPGGKQPMSNEDGSVVVVFNGEIYNYKELRHQLQAQGHQLATSSDTEVIVHLYEEYGDRCVDHLRGMFAFALWDAPRRRLVLARDRIGVKPLYYALEDGRLVFGSEIKAVLRHPKVRAELDPMALSNFLSLKYVPAPQTMFSGIRAIPPGCLLVCDEGGASIRQYWDLSFDDGRSPRKREEEYLEQLEELLKESVRMELMSDVPFGAFLSGGLDSSTIVALMSQFLREPVKTFSVGFEGEGAVLSELPYARLVAERFQTDHHEVLINAQDFIDLAAKVVWHLDQPIADEACLANYMVSELASRHVKMVLTGEGGDELFAGYARYAGEQFSTLVRRVPKPLRAAALAGIKRLPGMRRPKIALFALSQEDEAVRLTNWFPLFNQEKKAHLLSEAFRRQLPEVASTSVFAEQLARTDATDPLSRMLYLDTKLWLPDDLLARGDKTSMANSLEARVPLLDHKLVEFAAGLPSDMKLRGLTRKYLLKQAARKWLPSQIVDRPKKGFPIPVGLWFRKEARQLVRDTLSPQSLQRRGLFDPDYVEALLGEHESGFADHGNLIWGLLSVELWHQQFIDPAANASHRPAEALALDAAKTA